MDYKNAKKYLKDVERDVQFVDEAIKKGAYLTFEEWHDFLYKSCVACFKSKSIGKYEAVNKRMAGLARMESYILSEIMDIQFNGFTEFTSECTLRNVISRLNRVLGFSNRLSFYRTDEDGVVTFTVDSRDMEETVEAKITDRDALSMFLVELWGMAVSQMHLYNNSITEFLKNHLVKELVAIYYGKAVKPYTGGVKTNTLQYVLSEQTDYEVSISLPFTVIKPETGVATS